MREWLFACPLKMLSQIAPALYFHFFTAPAAFAPPLPLHCRYSYHLLTEIFPVAHHPPLLPEHRSTLIALIFIMLVSTYFKYTATAAISCTTS
jgi:hypothetical protein